MYLANMIHSHNNNGMYTSDFEFFLKHTNEKDVLFNEIVRLINQYKISTLMDIGAGDGLLSIPLSKKVKKYYAVESNLVFALKLRNSGINVLAGAFPNEININNKYDMVLMSHSLSYKKDVLSSYLSKAWRYVKRGGIMLIVTYRKGEDEWTKLISQITMGNIADYNRFGYQELIDTLCEYGRVHEKSVKSWVQSDDFMSMVRALSFVFASGDVKRKRMFMEYAGTIKDCLEREYKINGLYSFPFNHYLITVNKR